MKVYRISKEKYSTDHSGKGAALFGGRWNSLYKPVLYTSGSISLAALEIIAHLSDVVISESYSLITYDLSAMTIGILSAEILPPEWNLVQNITICQEIGDAFLSKNEYPVLKVPSAIIPIEYNYLINPLHRSFIDIKVENIQPFEWDKRIIKSSPSV